MKGRGGKGDQNKTAPHMAVTVYFAYVCGLCMIFFVRMCVCVHVHMLECRSYVCMCAYVSVYVFGHAYVHSFVWKCVNRFVSACV